MFCLDVAGQTSFHQRVGSYYVSMKVEGSTSSGKRDASEYIILRSHPSQASASVESSDEMRGSTPSSCAFRILVLIDNVLSGQVVRCRYHNCCAAKQKLQT